MIERIKKALAVNNIDLFLINETEQTSSQLFFIKKNLDTNRISETIKYEVTIYKDFEKDGIKMRGFSTCNIYPDMPDDDLSKKLKDTLYSAGFACNPYFDFPHPRKDKPLSQNITGKSKDEFSVQEAANNVTTELFINDNSKDCFINSAEIFIKKCCYHTISSWGTDVSYDRQTIEGEFVVQCTTPEDVETYQDFYYTSPDAPGLSDKVQHAIELTRQRAIALRCGISGNLKLILSDKYVAELLDFYTERAAASMIYPKYSDFEVGKQVQHENITGDSLNITLKADLPYSYEGIKMQDIALLENGILKNIHGPARFCHYLGINPTGVYKKIAVAPGKQSFENMKSGRYLHVVNFSDFQMDKMSGRFGGEFRLAFYSDGTKVTPITGGSVSGSILDLAGNITLSAEMQNIKNYIGPLAISIENVSVG